MKRRAFEGQMPNGEITASTKKYLKAWDELLIPLQKMGFRVIAFDPGIRLCDEAGTKDTFTIPVYAALAFLRHNAPANRRFCRPEET